MNVRLLVSTRAQDRASECEPKVERVSHPISFRALSRARQEKRFGARHDRGTKNLEGPFGSHHKVAGLRTSPGSLVVWILHEIFVCSNLIDKISV